MVIDAVAAGGTGIRLHYAAWLRHGATGCDVVTYLYWLGWINAAIGGDTLGRIQNEVHYSGRVQGVGFRFTTQQVARRHAAVVGFVENLVDGRVRLVVEGDGAQVSAFLEDVKSTMADYIREVNVKERPVTEAYTSFEIRQ